LGDLARISGVCALAGALAFAFTSAVRRTTAAVVGFLALLFIVEPVLIHAWHGFRGRTPVYALLSTTVNQFSNNGGNGFAGYHSLSRSVLVLAIWAVALLVVCGSLFARREVR
jgi:hypothetical protein